MNSSSLETFFKWINTPIIHIGGAPLTLGGLFSAVMVVLGSLMVSRILRNLLEKQITKQFKLTSGMTYAILRILHYSILVLGVILASQCIGLNLGSLTVLFGFLSVGIGFGLQNITSNFIAGIILLLERPISVGDLVEVDDKVGKVLKINMRATVIMTLDNIAIIVPNSKFIEEHVTNWSIEDVKVRLKCPVGVAYGSDIEKVKAALLKVAHDHSEVLNHPEPKVWFSGFGDSSLDFKLLVWINDAVRQNQVQSDINYMIDAIFREKGIEIPFPQRDVHLIPSDGLRMLSSKASGGGSENS